MQRIDPDRLARQAESLSALARRLVFDADAADDVVQDTCLAALERGPRPGVPLGAWLVRVMRNLAARRHRDAQRQQRALEALATRRAAADPPSVHERVALHRRLLDAVRRLDEPYRMTVLLRYFDGLPPRVIAVRMDVSWTRRGARSPARRSAPSGIGTDR